MRATKGSVKGGKALHVRLGPKDERRIAALRSKMGALSRSDIGRGAVVLGLALLEKNPELVLTAASS